MDDMMTNQEFLDSILEYENGTEVQQAQAKLWRKGRQMRKYWRKVVLHYFNP